MSICDTPATFDTMEKAVDYAFAWKHDIPRDPAFKIDTQVVKRGDKWMIDLHVDDGQELFVTPFTEAQKEVVYYEFFFAR